MNFLRRRTPAQEEVDKTDTIPSPNEGSPSSPIEIEAVVVKEEETTKEPVENGEESKPNDKEEEEIAFTDAVEEQEEEEGEEEQPDNSDTIITIATSKSKVEAKEEEEKEREEEEEEDDDENRYRQGDHVYQWCSVAGVPRVFAHHGIVMNVEDLDEEEQLLTIVDFSNLLLRDNNNENQDDNEDEPIHDPSTRSAQSLSEGNDGGGEEDNNTTTSTASATIQPTESQRQQQQRSITGSNPFVLRSGFARDQKTNAPVVQKGGLRLYQTSSKESRWKKVTYQDRWYNTHLWKRSGTCTHVSSDPPEMVLKRVHFLLSHSHYNYYSQSAAETTQEDDQHDKILPNFHPVFANCECVAVYCKTGTWSTLQAASFLSHAAVGQVKATATLSGVAAAQTATVPAAGIWGWLGGTTTVPLMSVQPWILPALTAYGAVTIGIPAITLTLAKRKWKEITQRLNEALEAESLNAALVT